MRKRFEKLNVAVEEAEGNVAEANRREEDLKGRLTEAATRADLAELADIAADIQKLKERPPTEELAIAKNHFNDFYSNMIVSAKKENDLRDALKKAAAKEDYARVIEIAEGLKNLEAPKNSERLDLDATKKLFKDFSREFKYIGGLFGGKAYVQLDNGKYAFIDHNGAIVSKEYKFAYSYSEGKACVKLDNNKWAFIDQTGAIVSKEYKSADSYSEGKARVLLDNGKYAFIDHNEAILSKGYGYTDSYSEGKDRVQLDNGKWAFFDKIGAIVSKEYKKAESYSEGKACVQLDNGKYAFIDHNGAIVSKEYKKAESYFEGKARVQLDNGKYAFIDHDEEVIHFKE